MPRAKQHRYSIRPPALSRQGGFTLIEMVAAFVIFAIGFGILLQILSSSLHTTMKAADYTRAALWAQSLLDTQGIGEPLREGDDSGRFDDRFSWNLRVTKVDPPPVQQPVAPIAGNANGQGPVTTSLADNMDLFELDLDVSWGTAYLTHHARFVTLRTQLPDVADNGPNGFIPAVPRGKARK